VTNKAKTVHQWHEILNERFQGTPREAARYYGIEILPRLLHQLEKQGTKCKICQDYFKQIDDSTMHAASWMIKDDPRVKDFQYHLHKSGKHLSREHRIFPKGLVLSKHVGAALAMGIIISVIFSISTKADNLPGIIMLGATSGLAIGWITGKIKESLLRKKNRLF